MKSMVYLTCAFADQKNADIRLEAAAAKYFCSETLYASSTTTAGARRRGYERATSLYERGERRPASRWRSATCASAASSRLVAGDAPDHGARGARHALQAGDADPAAQAGPEGLEGRGDDEGGSFYSTWLPKLFMPDTGHHFEAKNLSEINRKHLAYAGKTSKLLARRLFATMAKFGRSSRRSS